MSEPFDFNAWRDISQERRFELTNMFAEAEAARKLQRKADVKPADHTDAWARYGQAMEGRLLDGKLPSILVFCMLAHPVMTPPEIAKAVTDYIRLGVTPWQTGRG